jgi:HEAT repeat protein
VKISLSDELETALASDEVGELDEIIRGHRPEHFQNLKKLVLADPAVKREYRKRALYALGRWGDRSIVPEIARVLPDLDETERITAIDTFGRLGTRQAFEAVIGYVRDPSPQIRKFVVHALGRIGSREAYEKLRTIANEDPEKWIQELAARRIEKH